MGTSNGYGTRRLGDTVYLSGDRGVYGLPVSMTGQIGEAVLIIDRYRYPQASEPLLRALLTRVDTS
jgi:hypothetical protein